MADVLYVRYKRVAVFKGRPSNVHRVNVTLSVCPRFQSDADVLVLDTDYDFTAIDDHPSTTANQSIGSLWRDMVVGEQMEGCLTRLEVTSKTNSYTDMDDPNYVPTYL